MEKMTEQTMAINVGTSKFFLRSNSWVATHSDSVIMSDPSHAKLVFMIGSEISDRTGSGFISTAIDYGKAVFLHAKSDAYTCATPGMSVFILELPSTFLDQWSGFNHLPNILTWNPCPEILEAADKLHARLMRDDHTEHKYASGLALALVNDMICESVPGKKLFAPKGKLSAKQMIKVLDLIKRSLHTDIHLSQMAAEVCLSEFHFSRLFRSSFGTSPYQFVLQMKVECAQSIMRKYPKSLSRIAHSLHFTDQAHFTNVFKKITGVCPTEFLTASSAAA